MNHVISYLEQAFQGRDLAADAQALELKTEELESFIKTGIIKLSMISAEFAKTLEAKIDTVKAKELLDAQLMQAKGESSSAKVAPARAESKKAATGGSVRAPSQTPATPCHLKEGTRSVRF